MFERFNSPQEAYEFKLGAASEEQALEKVLALQEQVAAITPQKSAS